MSCSCSSMEICWFPSRVTVFCCILIGLATSGQADAQSGLAAEAIVKSNLPERSPTTGSLFQPLSVDESGVDFVNPIDIKHPLKRLYHSGFVCGGVAIGDLNNDGKPDLFLNSGPRANRLYLQEEDLKFRDATADAGLAQEVETWSTGVTMVDVNGDRQLDLFICNYDAPNRLYLNNGDGTFDYSADSGLGIADASLSSSFADFDKDGDLDCFLLTNRNYRANGRPESPPVKMENGVPVVLDEFQKYYRIKQDKGQHFNIEEYGRADRLFRNNGDGTFQEVTAESGIAGEGHGLSMLWWDYDEDGWMDIYICNDFDDPDYIWRNNGDGTFTNMIANVMPHTSWFSMGSALADVNNDGLLDFFSVDMSATNHFRQKTTMGVMNAKKIAAVAGPPQQTMRNSLLLNSGKGRFLEAAYLAGVADSDWSWAPVFSDYDCDGRVDLFISNGMARNFTDSDVKFTDDKRVGQTVWDFYEDTSAKPDRNLAFRNVGDLEFADVSKEWGLDHFGMSYSTAHGDLDGDGDIDLVVANLDEPVKIFRNDSQAGHRAVIRLQGKDVNRFGVGAMVQLTLESETAPGGVTTLLRPMNPYTGYQSSNMPEVHFGLGDVDSIQRMVVRWPSGELQTFSDLPVDHVFTISEPEKMSVTSMFGLRPKTSFPYFRSHVVTNLAHKETPFDDFALQPLLPNKLSQLGPGMAVADVNGDGRTEVYLAGAAGFPGGLYTGKNNGYFGKAGSFEGELAREDMGCLFFDAEGDGDLDLYVVSGGVECGVNAELLEDRLYVFDSKTAFTLSEDALPKLTDSGGCVAAADFDRDGDLDLFIGGRVIPGDYPMSPQSRLLVNKSVGSPKFEDGTEEFAPDVAESGLVTSALWTDVDADGWLDLMTTNEWGPVRLFRNERGTLREDTKAAGLAEKTGWFNGISGRDIDNDGDIDYVVTNFGLNTKYHASADHPALLYYGDFEGNGRKRLVEAEEEDNTLFPVRGKSCSTNAIPSLGKKFDSYKLFALSSLEDIYTPKCLDSAHRFSANTLESSVLINDGSGHFTFRPLPRFAQISPGFAVQLTEVNGDGYADALIAQNFFSPQSETGNFDGGLSVLLLGNGDGSFRSVWPDDSGIAVPGDAKSMAMADLNQDGAADFLIATNSGPVHVFLSEDNGKKMALQLSGPNGNRQAFGARVAVIAADGSRQTAEVYAGGSYLSQSTADLFFAKPEGPGKVEVVWPDGTSSSREFSVWDSRIQLAIEE